MEHLSDAIKIITKNRGLTIKELCKNIGMSESGFYSALSKGNFKLDTLDKICDELGITVSMLYEHSKRTAEGSAYILSGPSPEENEVTPKTGEEILKDKARLFKRLTAEIEADEKALLEKRLQRDSIYMDLL